MNKKERVHRRQRLTKVVLGTAFVVHFLLLIVSTIICEAGGSLATYLFQAVIDLCVMGLCVHLMTKLFGGNESE